MPHRHHRRPDRAREKVRMAWTMFGGAAEALENQFSIPAEICVEAAWGAFTSRPLACAACDSPHEDPASLCITSDKDDENQSQPPFVVWFVCGDCMNRHNGDFEALALAAEPVIEMWMATHQFPGSVAFIDEDGPPQD